MVRWESELIPILSEAKQKLRGGSETAVEVASGYGIADLVFFDFDKNIIEERIRQKLSPIEHANLLRILLGLEQYTDQDSISITTLRKNAPFLKDELITYLINNHFLIDNSTDSSKQTFKKGTSYKNGLQDVIAIEAKLRDWKRGLYQAYRYRSYADKSYLAIYTKAIKPPLKNIDQFKKYNVGLIEVMDEGIKVHFNPRKEKHSDAFTKAVAYESLLGMKKDIFPDFQEIPRLVTI